MKIRANLLFAVAASMSIGLGVGNASAGDPAPKPSMTSSATQQAMLSVQSSADEERIKQREEELKLIEWARKERERKAADEEKLRLARKQRAEETISGTHGGCTIKPVMSDSDMEVCRRAGR